MEVVRVVVRCPGSRDVENQLEQQMRAVENKSEGGLGFGAWSGMFTLIDLRM